MAELFWVRVPTRPSLSVSLLPRQRSVRSPSGKTEGGGGELPSATRQEQEADGCCAKRGCQSLLLRQAGCERSWRPGSLLLWEQRQWHGAAHAGQGNKSLCWATPRYSDHHVCHQPLCAPFSHSGVLT